MARPDRSLVPATEVALIAVSLAAVASFQRLFADGSFFFRLAAFAMGSHLLALLARRLRWSLGASAALSLVGLAFVTSTALYPSTTQLGIPTADTMTVLREDLSHVYTQFQSVLAPTAVTTGFLLAAGIALWWAAFVADWAAFRLWVPFESIVPAGTVFVFASLFAADRHRVDSAALFLAAVLVFLLFHRVARQQVSAGWMSTDVRRGTNTLLAIGGGLAVCTVVAGVIIGPRLPQADADALVNWRGDRSGPGSRTTVSPFVEIRKRLVDQSRIELFTVQSDQRGYWRLTSLNQFDGQLWSSNGSYDKASGGLPSDVGSDATKTEATQTYSIARLGTIWVPAAFEPRRIDAGATNVRYEPESSTLIVGSDLPNSDGVTYTVQSQMPIFDAAQLDAATSKPPGDIVNNNSKLPADFSASARELANQVTAGQATAYAKALALQDYFRNNFTYSLDVPPGQSSSAIDEFLESKSGYCEQFAGTFAAMARAAGLPARVAVGFTPGDADPDTPGLYHVRGEHAHAWPEVFIAGQGWVLFEPTPTRGAPNAEQYTGVPEQQSTGGGVSATTLVPATSVPTPTSGPAATGPSTTRPDVASPEDFGGSTFVDDTLRRIAIGAGIVALLVLTYCLIVPAMWIAYRARRRKQATDPTAKVEVAWAESAEAAAVLGVGPRAPETPAEYAERAGRLLQDDSLAELASILETAEYSAEGVADDEGMRAFALSDHVVAVTKEQASRGQRVRAALDPRPPDRREPRGRPGRRGPSERGDAPAIEMVSLTRDRA
jgi:transglutaminase-like putative cysteine protease